jgi:glycosyltransferase involved in cell wall biosynthesis
MGIFAKSLLRSSVRGGTPPSDIRGIYLFRESIPLGWAALEKWRIKNKPVLLDFDDAIWLPNVSESNRAFGWLKGGGSKTPALLRLARVVTVCNDFLAEYARKYAQDVRIIPTTIDTDLYQPRRRLSSEYVTIGWTGSFTTLAHLRTIEAVLVVLHRKYGSRIRFRFIGAPQYRPPFPAEVLPWRAETEVEDISPIDIGIMPLPDDDWSRGKCALKALQYMALAIPPVVSAVGMNCQVVREGENGFLATTSEEWIEKLSYLIENPEERARLGAAARYTVEQAYSVRANLPKYIAAFEAAFGKVQ